MSGARITIDGLWRCLCPSIDAATFTRAVSTPHPYRPRLSPPHHHSRRGRSLHTTPRRLEDRTPRDDAGHDGPPPVRRILAQANGKDQLDVPTAFTEKLTQERDRESQPPPPPDINHGIEGLPSSAERDPFHELANAWDGNLAATPPSLPSSPIPPNAAGSGTANLASTPPPPPPSSSSAKTITVDPYNVQQILNIKEGVEIPSDVTNDEVLEALRYTRDLQRPKWRTLTTRLVRHLLAKGVPPTTFIYETLLMAHSQTEGSAEVVRNLLSEMREKRVPWSSTIYHSALRALTIHPDYVLRADVLRQMKERWIEVTPRGHQYIALGLLRDEQYELALEKLEEMINQGEAVEPWVFDIFIYVFGKLEFLDDALQIARHRLDTGYEVPVNIWYFLLDACSKSQNYDATTYIWARTVPPRLVQPPDGVCLQVLNMAASYGDADLATQVLQFLASRGTKLGQAHYEAVADAYCVQGNFEKAIEAFCIMHAARVETTTFSMGALSQALHNDPSQIDAVILTMDRLKETHKIPLVVFNAILNQIVKHDLPDQDTYARALRFYHRIREFCYEGPNWETFRHLLWRCADPDLAQVVAGEMSWFGIRHNKITSELMFQVQVNHNGPSYRAKRYFYMVEPHYRKESETAPVIKSSKWQRFMDLSVKFVRRLISERDPEAWRILAYCQQNGLEEDVIKALREDVESGKIVMQQEEETNQDGDGIRWESDVTREDDDAFRQADLAASKKEDERDVF